ncbi:glycine betaine ABC transporter substrate-binding protein [Tenuibacillus multivorans]|uniref:Glycine betaine/proline transport system substrate-binding protein n=1 Tax=Tenuibacillus multivorans TaxID=237069 RepID=A0A1H0A4V9_9BACI|nr:glycine betaine ABC transporter substrate-binding protein [Tenuibacillus multivorans]GEL78389.1 glycine/betaine ABC transporter substrate-binding protein [Tenuibacillus multivorans]SDN28495.1 glycine betaine/proline transport system substrate-binding protein [Tenuibacillus multivorans]
MNLFTKKNLFVITLTALLLVAGCGSGEENNEENTDSNNETNGSDEAINYSEEVEYTITGIEPGAGITVTTEKAIEEYENLNGWQLEQSSTAAMVTALDEAISNEEPIIVTGWNPHWKFAKYPDLKYLDDPKGVYGEAENIQSLARQGLKEDKPNAYKLIDQFEWDVEDMESIMYESKETGDDIDEVAKRWVEDNQEKVSQWLEGVEDVDGVEVELASTPWDSERASSSVLAEAMSQKGFDVTVTPVDVAAVFEAVGNGDVDATIAAWLPLTHNDFYQKVKDDVVDLGPNLQGAKIGIVVPEYVDLESIEDLEPAE